MAAPRSPEVLGSSNREPALWESRLEYPRQRRWAYAAADHDEAAKYGPKCAETDEVALQSSLKTSTTIARSAPAAPEPPS